MGRGRGNRRNWALAASTAAHAALLAGLAWHLGRAPQPAEPPVFDVKLVTLDRKTPRKAPRPQPARPVRQAVAMPAPPVEAPTPLVVPAARPAGDGPRPALRALVGCERTILTREERERCRERQFADAGRPGRDPARLNLDPTGRFAVEEVPYLARKPHNECKLMAGGTTAPGGKQGEALGIACAFSF